MGQRNVVLQGIAAALNGVGSALVSIYDLAASSLGNVLPGEKEKLKGKIREYEQKIERLYSEVGKEISKEGETTRLSAAGEAALVLIAEHRIEIEKIKQGIQAAEEAERKGKERVPQEKESGPKAKGQETEEPVIISPISDPEGIIEKETEPGETLAEPAPAETIASPGLEMEAEKETRTEEAEPPTETLPPETPDAEGPIMDNAASDVKSEVETETEKEALPESAETPQGKPAKYTRELLGNKLKGDLLALGTEKGIAADKNMTKAEIIELLLKVT
jgi:hypothetical protein